MNCTTKYDDLPQFLTPAEAPGLLGVGRATIYEILRRRISMHSLDRAQSN